MDGVVLDNPDTWTHDSFKDTKTKGKLVMTGEARFYYAKRRDREFGDINKWGIFREIEKWESDGNTIEIPHGSGFPEQRIGIPGSKEAPKIWGNEGDLNTVTNTWQVEWDLIAPKGIFSKWN